MKEGNQVATVSAPLMSLAASGKVGGAIVFSTWKGRPLVRKLVKPHNPKSGLQTGVRAGMRFMTQQWKLLSATIQGHWAAINKSLKITPLNSLVKANQTRIRQGLGLIQDPTLAAGAVEAAPGTLAATALPKSINVTWIDSVGANDWCTLIWMSTVAAFVPSTATLVAIVAKGTQKWAATGLVSGTPYYFRAGGSETGGTLGTLAAQVTATPT